MANIEELLDRLELNDADNEDVVATRFVDLLAELRPNVDASLLLLNDFALQLGFGFGQYGSINLGNRGATYNQVRKYLVLQQTRLDLPILRRYLTEPLANLPLYTRNAGPGGQGAAKIALNRCWGMIRDRIQRVLGMLVVVQTNAPGEFAAQPAQGQ